MPRHARSGSDLDNGPRIVYVQRESGPCEGCIGAGCLKSTWNCGARTFTVFVIMSLVVALGMALAFFYAATRMNPSSTPYWWGQILLLVLLLGTIGVILLCNATVCYMCCGRADTPPKYRKF